MPQPGEPMTAVALPISTLKEMSSKIKRFLSGQFGYLKLKFSTLISLAKVNGFISSLRRKIWSSKSIDILVFLRWWSHCSFCFLWQLLGLLHRLKQVGLTHFDLGYALSVALSSDLFNTILGES